MVRRWYDAYPDCAVYNVYGTTETAIISHCYRVPSDIDGVAAIPVGRALPDMRVRLLDGECAVDDGEAGESVVSGPQLAAGYWGSAYQTRAVFGPDPLDAAALTTVYHTGDRLRRTADGLYHYVGRTDSQLKLRGHRVELGEVEQVLARDDAVRDVAVVAVAASARAGDERLVAFVQFDDPAVIDGAAVRRHAAAVLPDYMVPAAVLPVLGDFPRNANGKVDRAALGRLAGDSLTREVRYGT